MAKHTLPKLPRGLFYNGEYTGGWEELERDDEITRAPDPYEWARAHIPGAHILLDGTDLIVPIGCKLERAWCAKYGGRVMVPRFKPSAPRLAAEMERGRLGFLELLEIDES